MPFVKELAAAAQDLAKDEDLAAADDDGAGAGACADAGAILDDLVEGYDPSPKA